MMLDNGNKIYISNLENYSKPLQTPFDIDGKTAPGNRFLYLTNTSTERWSYLYREENEKLLMKEYAPRMPCGRLGLMIVEKIYSIKPDNEIIVKSRFEGESHLKNNYFDVSDKAYGIFKAPEMNPYYLDYHDIICFEEDENKAIEAANLLCRLYKIPHLVGRLIDHWSLW